MAAEWHRQVVGRPPKPCVNPDCKTPQARIHGHHLIVRSRLERCEKERGLPRGTYVWSQRSGAPVCEVCHLGHHDGIRLPRSVLTDANWNLIDELDLRWWIERYYPEGSPTNGR